jgi:signal transduction histidine kinase
MADKQLSFKIKSGLKNIIGRDLITDDYVAVFELVKNSFDAYAKKVTITFQKDKIIITDDGKGMDLNDINNKWLAVAYSAKKEGIEDDELEEKEFDSYRDKIQAKKFFAGAKGIGRFSCDRLGNRLTLTSKKASSNAKIEQIEVNWSDFEKDSKEEFIDIKVKHRTLQPITKKLKGLRNGTILEIAELNSNWNREKKLNLKYSLEKLINPFEDNPLNGFTIHVEDEIEKERDKGEKEKRNKVNGEVKNFIFETLGLKTTQILTEIDSKAEYITTTLWDRETLIYKIRRRNNTIPELENIKIHIFHLNRSAKTNFTRLMGIEPYRFGSIFVYKNGFRVPPYGDFGLDYFGLDSRKAQKHFDRFGSRDLIGRIEIIGANPNFRESSSRDGGLVRNEYYNALVKFLINTLLKLENYANDVLFTNKEDKDKDDLSALNNIAAKSALLNLISDEIDDDQTELLDTDKKNLNIRAQELLQEASVKDIQALKTIAEKLGDKIFSKEAGKTEKELEKVLELQKRLEEEEEARKKAEDEKKKLADELALEKEKNTYLRTSSRSLSEDAKGLVHNIKITAKEIDSNVDSLLDRINEGKEIKQKDLLRRLQIIKFNAQKALKISRLITRSNFRTEANDQIVDIVKYVEQYLNVYSEIYEGNQLQIKVKASDVSFTRKISVLELSLVFDNLISNSFKAKAKSVSVEFKKTKDDSLEIYFSDDGKGVIKEFLSNSESLFELGVTRTEGSGIGLYSVKKALHAMKANIVFLGNGKFLKGATFRIEFE